MNEHYNYQPPQEEQLKTESHYQRLMNRLAEFIQGGFNFPLLQFQKEYQEIHGKPTFFLRDRGEQKVTASSEPDASEVPEEPLEMIRRFRDEIISRRNAELARANRSKEITTKTFDPTETVEAAAISSDNTQEDNPAWHHDSAEVAKAKKTFGIVFDNFSRQRSELLSSPDEVETLIAFDTADNLLYRLVNDKGEGEQVSLHTTNKIELYAKVYETISRLEFKQLLRWVTVRLSTYSIKRSQLENQNVSESDAHYQQVLEFFFSFLIAISNQGNSTKPEQEGVSSNIPTEVVNPTRLQEIVAVSQKTGSKVKEIESIADSLIGAA